MTPTPEEKVLPDEDNDGLEDESKTSTIPGDDSAPESDNRDEEHEIRMVARRDTNNVVMLRFIVTVVLVITAIAVTWTTYFFLQRQQTDNFEKQFEQFSRTVADAALDQQQRARLACRGLADTITAFAQSTNVTWPLFYMPLFEKYAHNVIKQSSVEVLGLFPLVRHEYRDDWVAFVNDTYVDMVAEAHMLRNGNLDGLNPVGYNPFIAAATPQGFFPDMEREQYFPNIQFAPAPRTYGFINWNIYSNPVYGPLFDDLLEMKTETLISVVKPYDVAAGIAFTKEQHAEMHKHVFLEDSQSENPHSFMYLPVYEDVYEESEIVAILGAPFAWDAFMIGLLPEGVNGIAVVLENDCGQQFTYEVDGPVVRYLGEGDHHETKYQDMETYQDLTEGFHSHPLYNELDGHCRFAVKIYPTTRFEEGRDPFTPEIFAIVVAATFVIVTILFYLYDMFVHRRNEKLIANAAKSNAIVSSLFPSNIRDRLVNGGQGLSKKGTNNLRHFMVGSAESTSQNGEPMEQKPLADLFLQCTVCFADISGFTAWSSVREPAQVFMLLETIYGAFDQIAKRRRTFKVETVGDCYVAATGLPDYRKDHAVLMVRFARDILAKMSWMTKELETTLGPDTGDLSLRIGIHTGPVTAGVLRGDRARFQLFGDTMNVCSRIESAGVAGRIHVSSDTADSLRENGRSHWLIKRDGTVAAKGKGEIQTYWIGAGVEADRRESSFAGSAVFEALEQQNVYEPLEHNTDGCHEARMLRLVDWNVATLSQILKHVVARRRAKAIRSQSSFGSDKLPSRHARSIHNQDESDQFTPLDEVKEIIQLPGFDPKVSRIQEDPDKVILPPRVLDQLRHYVQSITGMYNDNSFHNFEHASHVSMSVVKLLSRIVAPPDLMENDVSNQRNGKSVDATLHDHTYGITSDPLTQFSCAFAAMIHDVDHVGVPNAQLVKEQTRLAQLYDNRSVAEQNSLVLAWDLLMMPEYDELRSTIGSDKLELERFRQLVVNAVMATDIVDADLKKLRDARWTKAFNHESGVEEDAQAAVNRKATIVIEHLIQASDVAHTMQHWHVYRKWNEKFFCECYKAYKDGRAATDPSEGWYKGELGFFDFYIIPLAKKLKECGVFGKSSDEYLNYAVANRNEWEKRGREVVAEMVEFVQTESS